MARWDNKGGRGLVGHACRSVMSASKAYNWQFNMPGDPLNLEAYSSYNNQFSLWNKLF
jgi:hypothetical protein